MHDRASYLIAMTCGFACIHSRAKGGGKNSSRIATGPGAGDRLTYQGELPPLTQMVWPVTKEASSLA